MNTKFRQRKAIIYLQGKSKGQHNSPIYIENQNLWSKIQSLNWYWNTWKLGHWQLTDPDFAWSLRTPTVMKKSIPTKMCLWACLAQRTATANPYKQPHLQPQQSHQLTPPTTPTHLTASSHHLIQQHHQHQQQLRSIHHNHHQGGSAELLERPGW